MRWARRQTTSSAAGASVQKPRLTSRARPASRSWFSTGTIPAGLRIQGSAWGATRDRTRVWARWLLAAGCPMAPMAMRIASERGGSLSSSWSVTQRTGI